VSQDWPFSVTSKFTVIDTGAEHLVTIRAATAADMRSRLAEASAIFPYAALITALEQETAQAQPAVLVPAAAAQAVQERANGGAPTNGNGSTHLDYPGRPYGRDQVADYPPSNGNGNGHRSPVATAVACQTQRANQRNAQARVDRKTALPHLCPEHGIALPSKKAPRSYYCPTQLDDGSYCKWRWAPADAGQGHPRDEN
jgi:hypothetical protein